MTNPPVPPEAGASPLESDPAFFRSLVESSPEIIAVVDPDGQVRYASPAARALLARTAGEPQNRGFLQVVHPNELDRVREAFAAAARNPPFEERTAEIRVARLDGHYVWIQTTVRRLSDGPAAGHFLLQLRDVSARGEARERLRDAEEQLRRVVDQLPIVLLSVDTSGVVTLAEGKGLAALALEPEEMIGRSLFEIYDADDPGLIPFRQALAGRVVRSRSEIEDRVWDTHAEPVRDEQGNVIGAMGVTLDVTEASEQEKSAAFQALLLDSVGEAVVATDPYGAIIYWNRGAETLFGWPRTEAIGRSIREMVPEEAEQEDPASMMVALRRGESRSVDYLVQRRDGEIVPVLLTTRPVVEGGEVVALIGVAADLRKLKRLENQLRGSQKLEAVGQLAGGIAHDFNNLLTTIGGYAGMAAERVRDPQLASDISEIMRATERARVLVDQLLAFGNRSTVSLRPVDVRQTIRAMLAVIRRALKPAIRVEAELPDDLWSVRSDPAQLEQALINLSVNAGEAMPEGGRLTIRTDNVTLGPDAAARLEGPLPAGDYVRVIVQDTGVGMEPAVLRRIFEPFFTTKGLGKATGLGLSTVFGLMRSMGGGIEVDSVRGEGSRFSLYLPRSHDVAPDRMGTEEAGVGPGEPVGRPANILLVEDEPAVRRLARRILERDGHAVMEAVNGLEALRQVEAGATPDLVVTDVIMPEMGGGELAKRLRRLRPDLPFLFMSGYTADELEDRGIEATTAFLPKPFSPALLLMRVRQALKTAREAGGHD